MEMTVAGTAQDSHLIPFSGQPERSPITIAVAKVQLNERKAKIHRRNLGTMKIKEFIHFIEL